jgi:hypothetical protein
MEPVSKSSSEFTALEAYARDTHGQTHRHYAVFVKNAFRVERLAPVFVQHFAAEENIRSRQSETDAWNQAGFHSLDDGHRLLLWHGSRTTNFAGEPTSVFSAVGCLGFRARYLEAGPPNRSTGRYVHSSLVEICAYVDQLRSSCNWYSLRNGLCPGTSDIFAGYMFGKGVYFADVSFPFLCPADDDHEKPMLCR